LFGLVVAAAVLAAGGVEAADPEWSSNFKESVELAKAQKRVLLVYFSGSDWCMFCKLLDQEVLSQKVFTEYAAANLVLFKADFPRTTALPEEVAQQNQALAGLFGVQGFPTIVVVDAEGRPVGMLGYQPGGPEAFVAAIREMTKGKSGK
jgi:protein disulfide-isomerase